MRRSGFVSPGWRASRSIRATWRPTKLLLIAQEARARAWKQRVESALAAEARLRGDGAHAVDRLVEQRRRPNRVPDAPGAASIDDVVAFTPLARSARRLLQSEYIETPVTAGRLEAGAERDLVPEVP